MYTSPTAENPNISRQVQALLGALSLVSLVAGLVFGSLPAFTPSNILIWFILLVAFVIHEASHHPANGSSWLGLRGAAIMMVALLLGAFAAGALLIAGLVGTFVVAQRQNAPILTRTLVSGALGGLPLLILVALPLAMPVAPLLVDNGWLAVTGAILAAWGAVQLVGGGLLASPFDITPIWEKGGRLAELTAVTQIIPLTIVAQETGVVVFAFVMIGVTVASVMERRIARRENTLEQWATEISEINEMGRRLAAHLVMDDLLNELRSMMQTMLPTRVLAVALYNPEEDVPVLQYVMVVEAGNRDDKEGYYTLKPNSVEALALADSQTLHYSAESGAKRTPLLLPVDPVQCMLTVPLSKAGRLTGLLVLADDTRTAFTPSEIELAETVARQVGMAIENARLYTSRARLIDNLAAINISIQTLLFNLDSDEAIQTICETAMHITQAERAAVYLMDTKTHQLKQVHAINLPEAYANEPKSVDHLEAGGGTHIIHDTYLEDDYNLRASSDRGGFRAVAETPLTSNSMVIGMLTVYHEQPYDYPTTEVDLLQVLANQITVALENADLLRALEMYAAEMAQLVHLSRSSLISLQPEEVATNAVDTLRQMFNVSSAMIAVVTPVEQGNEVITVLGQAPDDIYTPDRQSLMLYPELKSLRDRIEAPRRFIHLDDAETSRGIRQLMSRNGQKTIATVPMFAQDNVFGVIILGNNERRTFTPREWQFIETATNLTAAQVQNARLHKNTQQALLQRLEQLGYIEKLVQQISSSLDMDSIFASVFDATYRVTQAEVIMLAQADGAGSYRVIRQDMMADDATQHVETVAELTGALAEVFETGAYVLSPAYGLPDDMYQTPMLGRYPSVLAVPLVQEGRTIGVLCAESSNRAFFNTEQVEYLQNLGGHIVISLANAGLLGERQAQVEALDHLRQLSLRVARAGSRFAVAEHIMETAVQLLGGDGMGIYLAPTENEHPQLLPSPWRNVENGSMQTFVPPQLSGEEINEILRQNKVQIRQKRLSNGETRALLLIPIVRGDTTRALLLMAHDSQGTLSESDYERIDLLADHAASYLENIILYEQISTNSNRMRAILESTHDGVMLLDRQNRVLDYNTAAERLFGLDMAEWQHRKFETLPLKYTTFVREDVPREMMEDAERNGNTRRELQRLNLKLERGEEDTIYLERTDLPVYDAQNRIIGSLLVLRDISEDMELAQYRDEVIFMLVHDLRSPLGSVISGLNFAQDLANDPNQLDYLPEVMTLALRGANRLMNLINTLLDVERSQMTVMLEQWDMDALLDSAYGELAQAAQEVNIEVTKAVDVNIPPVNVDGEKIQRVLINLLDNAIDYSQGRVHVSAMPVADGKWVEVRVNDDGPGVPPEKRKLVFGKFNQAANQQKRRTKHTGIGLTYCRRAVEAHGGKIWVAEEDDGVCTLPGACFVFRLPVAGVNTPNDPTLQEHTG